MKHRIFFFLKCLNFDLKNENQYRLLQPFKLRASTSVLMNLLTTRIEILKLYRVFVCTIDYLNCFYKTINVLMYRSLHTAVFQDLCLYFVLRRTLDVFISNTNKMNIDLGA